MKMTIEVAQTLVSAGYLKPADVELASELLANITALAEAQETLDRATRDKTYQDGVLAEAIEAGDVDLEMGAYKDREDQQEDIQTALDQQEQDFTMITAAREKIAAASQDAAAALLAAGLIDKASLQPIAEVIATDDGDDD